MQKKRVYGYCRVSTTGQALDGDSLSVQRDKIKSYCQTKNLTLISPNEKEEVYYEEGVSGAIPPRERPQFRKLMANLEADNADGFVVCKIDRLSRSTIDFLNFMDEIRDKYHFFCLQQDIDTTTPQGKFSLVLFSGLAELERNMTKERVKEVMVIKKQRGERIGTIPFGFKLIEGTKLLEKDDEEQKTISIVKDYRQTTKEVNGTKKNMTYKEICDQLVKMERKNKEGRVSWFPSQIKKILNDGKYIVRKDKLKKNKN
jgi:DNA invertase Pin-like site-specific DNA recombinase